MQDILLGRIGKDVAAYLDDIMIYTQKGSDHQLAVTSVLEMLSKHNLWLKPEKCEFSRPEVEYLGLLISCNCLRMDPAKVKAVTNWLEPQNVTELQRFIGFSNFYCRFINHFSGTARPLHDLKKAKTQFIWDNQCNAAFETLKTAFTTAPILKIADPYGPFVLECDCSDFALGAVLSQVCEKDKALHPVAFLSCLLIQSEKNYEIFDKELLAIFAAFKEWCHYLEGNPHRLKAIVYNDHQNLESFMTTKALTRRQARWAETLGCFDSEIVFRPGKKSSKPDALSHQTDLAPVNKDKLTFGQLLRPKNITDDTFAEVAEFDAYFQDESVELDDAKYWFQIDVLGVEPDAPDTREVKEIEHNASIIQKNRELTPLDERLQEMLQRPDTVSADGIIYTRGMMEVPSDEELKYAIFRSRHDCRLAGHLGRSRTLALVRRSFTWPLAKQFINRYVDGCASCQRAKPSTLQPFSPLDPLPILAGPWTDISYDMIMDLPPSNGFNSILTVVNCLTKMSHFVGCRKTMMASQLAELMLRNMWQLHGTPKTIVLDRGSIFTSQITRELNNRLGIWLQPSTTYHPHTDGQSEIANKAVELYLRHYVQYHQNDWEDLLAKAEFAYNNNHTSTGISPFRANYGFHPCFGGIPSAKQCIPAVKERLKQLASVQDKLRECLVEAQEAMKIQFNKGVRDTPRWQVGDEVWLNSKQISAARPCPNGFDRSPSLLKYPSRHIS
jgi:hypothetical protein